MSTPNGMAITAAMTRPHTAPLPPGMIHHPSELPATLNIANAPTPAKVICAREIWPDHPVSGTSDIISSA